jgi:hypothetical protein
MPRRAMCPTRESTRSSRSSSSPSPISTAKEFYGGKLGWRLDADYDNGSDFRVIQFAPPGSGCSVIFGRNVIAAAPGFAQGLYLIVSDLAATRAELLGHGVGVSEVFHNEGRVC